MRKKHISHIFFSFCSISFVYYYYYSYCWHSCLYDFFRSFFPSNRSQMVLCFLIVSSFLAFYLLSLHFGLLFFMYCHHALTAYFFSARIILRFFSVSLSSRFVSLILLCFFVSVLVCVFNFCAVLFYCAPSHLFARNVFSVSPLKYMCHSIIPRARCIHNSYNHHTHTCRQWHQPDDDDEQDSSWFHFFSTIVFFCRSFISAVSVVAAAAAMAVAAAASILYALVFESSGKICT